MGNVNMEASQVHVRNNSHKTWHTVADAIAALDNQDTMVQEDITELYTRDSSRASKDDITNEFSAETAYYIGDYVYYEGSLFKFVENHAAGEWDPNDVITAQICNDITNITAKINYSTTEQPTGQKWIDGKDIYFKVVVLSEAELVNGNSWLSNVASIPGDTCIEVIGITDKYSYPFGGGFNNGMLEVFNLRNTALTMDSFIVWYTKA